jgi:cellulose synthase/poly-beta-1,6-N-acetylglucosamine synthase-like glycosyltransferase
MMRGPIPLGGTSNHVRKHVLLDARGWDPYNVTEDADRGVRLHRAGYRVGVLGSVTLEEANSGFISWVKQRSRWYKGYLQTSLLNPHHPVQTYRTMGAKGLPSSTCSSAAHPCWPS